MEREILFRAKRIDNGEWVEGSYVYRPKEVGDYRVSHYILVHDDYGFSWKEIDIDTICQYTGLTDKNGNKIWENDICSTDLERPFLIVEFRNGAFMYNCNDGNKDYYDIMLPTEPLEQQDKYTEVIGNIFDNPELLKG